MAAKPIALSLLVAVLGFACHRRAADSAAPPTVRSIVGGSVATTCQWPTAIMVDPIGCSGTLVHRRAIVTAKHCLVDEFGKPSPPTSIGIGEAASSFVKTVAIAKCYGHPTNDFAICTLAEDVTEIPIVPVMAPCEMPLLTRGATVVEAGFGADKVSDATYGTKKWISGTLSDNATNTIDVAVTSGSQDGEYYGDSGGPLYFRMPDTTWRLIGEDCCSDDIVSGSSAPRISTYTSVPFHVAWAEQQTGLDLTPCHDSRGWVGGDQCIGFPTDPGRTGGSWSSMCHGQSLLLAATCGGAIYDAGADGSGGTSIDAKSDTVAAETGDTLDAWTRDGSGSESAKPSLDGTDRGEVIDSSEAVDTNTNTNTNTGGTGGIGGAGGTSTGGTSGVAVDAGNGGTLGTGGATRGPGTGGMQADGAAGSNTGGMPQVSSTPGLGGRPQPAVDAAKDAAGGGTGPSSASGCSCRLQSGGHTGSVRLLFALISLVALRMRRTRRRNTEDTKNTESERRQKGSESGPFRSRSLLGFIRARLGGLVPYVALLALGAATACGGPTRPSVADAGSPSAEVGRGTGGALGAGGDTSTVVVDAEVAVVDAARFEASLDAPADPPGSLDAAAAETGGCTLADTIPVARLPSLSFASYHSVADIAAYLSGVAAALPEVVKVHTLGQSIQGRSIPYVVINATCQPTPPAVLLVGTHHGDEWSSSEATLAHVDYLLRGGADGRALLRSYAFYVLPVLNVDGHEANPPTRGNADGVDINRDYAYPERPESSAFKEKETQLVKALQDQVGFRAALTFHSGSTSVLWPWCYTATPAQDDARLSSVGATTAQAMGFNTYAASYFDYPTQGEYIDYAYMKSKTLAFTVEVSLVKTPAVSTIPQIVATAWKGTLALVQALQSKHAPAVAVPPQMIVHAPRRGTERLE